MFRTGSHTFTKCNTINPSRLSEDYNDVVNQIWDKYHSHGQLEKNTSYRLTDKNTQTEKLYRFTRVIKVFTINPLHLTQDQQAFLYPFLFGMNNKGVYKKNYLYPIAFEDKSITVFMRLTHKLVYRRCNSLGKYSGDFRYEVLSNDNPLGEGTFGKVKVSDGTLFENENHQVECKLKLFGKRRVVKILPAETESEIKKIHREYYISLLADHLHVKEPSIFDEKSYMVLRRMEGITLLELLENEKNGVDLLLFDRRMDLAIAILQAIDEQVHAKKIIHRDIKPNNVMVCQLAGKFYVNIIDYGISETFAENDGIESIQRFPFIAPEMRSDLLDINCARSDIYSVARVLSQLFGAASNLSFRMLLNEFENGFCMLDIFNNIPDFTLAEKNKIIHALSCLGHPNIDKRWSIQQGIAEFKSIKSLRAEPPINSCALI